MEQKKKICKACQQQKQIFSRGLCKFCADKRDKNKQKESVSAEKARLKRKAKAEIITEKKLDTIQSRVLRALYGDYCCTCDKKLTHSTLHFGHFCSRRFRATRFNPQNGASQCPHDNLHLSGLAYEMGLFINKFHGENTAEKLIALTKSDLKIGQVERNAIYQVYKDAEIHKDLQRLIEEYYEIFK